MTELEKMQRAKMYIDKLANGINPLDDNLIEDSDVVNNVRISRCLFYVSEILQQVIDNNGAVVAKSTPKVKKKPFALSQENIINYQVSEIPLTISEMVNGLNSMINTEEYKKINYKHIALWLVDIGMLEIISQPNGKNAKHPTEQGEKLGIFLEDRMGGKGPYTVTLYNEAAQRFIVDNIDTIVAWNISKQEENAENQWKPWKESHDECLADLFNKNVSISEIAVTLKRTEKAVILRLKTLGLIK